MTNGVVIWGFKRPRGTLRGGIPHTKEAMWKSVI